MKTIARSRAILVDPLVASWRRSMVWQKMKWLLLFLLLLVSRKNMKPLPLLFLLAAVVTRMLTRWRKNPILLLFLLAAVVTRFWRTMMLLLFLPAAAVTRLRRTPMPMFFTVSSANESSGKEIKEDPEAIVLPTGSSGNKVLFYFNCCLWSFREQN